MKGLGNENSVCSNNFFSVAYTIIVMRSVRITETAPRKRLGLVANSLTQVFRAAGVKAQFSEGEEVSVLLLEIPEHYAEFVLAEIKEKLAELISVGYKYDFFAENTKFLGLPPEKKELFLTAVIAADFPDDRRYVRRMITLGENFSVDGVYHFKLGKLTDKWKEIAECLPTYFGEELYRNFMQYLIDDFSDQPVYLVGDSVYDKRYGKRNLSLFLSEKNTPDPAQEILLCCGKEIHVVGEENTRALPFLRDFYGKTTHFHSGEGFGM